MGVHGTLRPDEMLDQTKAKAIIRGEPELTVLDICRSELLPDIDGITFMDNSSVIHTKDRELLSLDDLPIPAFHLIDVRNYRYEILGNRFLLLRGHVDAPIPVFTARNPCTVDNTE